MSDNHRTPQPPEPHPAVADRLRRTLQAVAAATPVEDRRAALLADLDTLRPAGSADPSDRPEEDDAMHLDARTDAPTPIWRRPLFLAAAAALVVAVAVGVLVGRPEEDLDVEPAVPDQVPATGWFLPPEGWEITEVRADFVDVGEPGACPCRFLVTASMGEDPSVAVVYESRRPLFDTSDGEPVAVDGRQGHLLDLGYRALAVDVEEPHVMVVANGVDDAVLVALADAWLDQLDAGDLVDVSALPLPDGMVAGRITPVGAERSAHVVDVTAVEAASGRRAYYQLAVSGTDLLGMIVDASSIEARDGEFAFRAEFGLTEMAGLVGGRVDITVGPSFFGEESDLSSDEAAAFLDALRPVDLDGWRRALDGVPAESEVLEAETLFGPPLVDTSVDELVDG